MAYRVFWSPDAEAQLERIVRLASAPAVVAAAARELDRKLAFDPVGLGESRYDGVRIAFIRPLGAQFEVLDDVRTVIVFHVWRADRKQ